MNDKVTDPEPGPLDSCGPDIVDLVKADLDDRRRVGIETYGMPLRAHNGRRPLRDLYAEMLDGIQYLRQEISEREALADELDAMAREWGARVEDPSEPGAKRLYASGMADAFRQAGCMIRDNHPREGS